jgi:hypothetical protein
MMNHVLICDQPLDPQSSPEVMLFPLSEKPKLHLYLSSERNDNDRKTLVRKRGLG